jgi:diguanylate cyclase (GGDEF)-like protein
MASQPLRLLVLEDDPRVAARLGADARFTVVHCATAAAAEAALAGAALDCALTRPGLLRDLRRIAPRLPVIALSDADEGEPPSGVQDQVSAHTAGGDLLALAVRDAIERKQAELELAHLALHDRLTGLPNRALLRERIAQALARLPRSGCKLALLHVSLEGIAQVNETHGYGAGDDLLVQVAERLRPILRQSDTVARLGAAEFAVLYDDLRPGAEVRAAEERVREALAKPFSLDGAAHRIAVSIGIAVAAAGDDDAEQLLRDAAAMPEGKRPIRVVVCDDEPGIRALMRHALQHEGDVLIVGEAVDGEAVVALVEEVRPDVVLLDLSMPKVDGLEALPRILAVAPWVGVVVLSGRDAVGAAQQALALGAERFMAKPARIGEIRAAVLGVGARAPA